MEKKPSRIERERKTIRAMVHLYCRDKHAVQNEQLCPDCDALLVYAMRRLEKCPYQEYKTTCAQCPVHCYKPGMRQRIREVMRYAGPRMIYRHPCLTIHHLIDGLRRKPGNVLKNN